MKRRQMTAQNEHEEVSFWQSYSDLMSAMLLMFVLVIASLLMRSMLIYQEKTKEEEEAKNRFEDQQRDQDKLKVQLEEQKKMFDEQQVQLEKMIGIKETIMVNLKQAFDKTDLTVSVDPKTGSIAFDSSIFFSSGSYELSEQGKQFLNSFIPVYFDALLHGEHSAYISEIIIEGHTDTVGGYMYNLELSQKRALSVSQYCLNVLENNPQFDLELIRKILTANGRSYSNTMKIEGTDEIDMDASRRVEFKVRVTDDEMISQMMEILQHE